MQIRDWSLVIGPNDQIHPDDKLIVFGTRKQIDALTERG